MSQAHSNMNESCNSIKLQEEDKSQEQQSEQQDRQSLNPSKKRIHRKQQISNFIMKTYKILEDKRNSHIIEWTDNGSCFIVKNKELFENEILPKYFKHKKFSSFVRQLNMYDFHKIRKEKQIPIFKHKFFKMDCFELLHKIKRKSGEDPKEDDPSRAFISHADISLKNEDLLIKSAPSMRSKNTINMGDDLEQLMRENNELRNSISEINRQIGNVELSRSKKQQKLIKILSAIIYFQMDNPIDGQDQKCSLRELQHHFMNQQEPLSFLEYAKKLSFVYREIRSMMNE